jgi:hypothetical protein
MGLYTPQNHFVFSAGKNKWNKSVFRNYTGFGLALGDFSLVLSLAKTAAQKPAPLLVGFVGPKF